MRPLVVITVVIITLSAVGVRAVAKEGEESITVTVVGTLRRGGVEINERSIVRVMSMKAVRDEKKEVIAKPAFHATVGRKDSRIQFDAEGNTTIFDVTSEFGIDKATVTRLTDEWPKSMVVRLHLKGLESFKVSNGEVTVQWAVGGDSTSRVTLWRGKEEIPLDKDSPYFTEARIDGDGKEVPLKDGYFEVPLPAKLFGGKPKEIRLHWIDFYRN